MNKKALFLSLLFVFILTSCKSNTTTINYTDTPYKSADPVNPYDSGSGHYAGFEWAGETGGNCDGNSDSFNEGCEEYYFQLR